MLSHLTIQNYALIDKLSLSIEPGYSVITGETGAGKSIIMGALSLVLGQRADTKVLRNAEHKCIVEATFQVANYGLKPLFNSLELDYEEESVVRRELLPNGKSRAFINDTPVNLNQLKQVVSRLIDIHSQHENLLLNESDFQRDLVDIVAKSQKELTEYQKSYSTYRLLEKRLQETEALALQWREERDYAQFQWNQLSEAQLIEGEQELLEQQLERLNHAEEVKTELSRAFQCLDNDDIGILSQLREATQAINKIGQYLPQGEELIERINSSFIELKDITSQIEMSAGDTEYNPNEKNNIESRLDNIYTLQQKHHVESIEELLALQAQYEEKLERIDAFDHEIESLQGEVNAELEKLQQYATALSQKRLSVKESMAHDLVEKLILLGIKNAQVEIQIEPISFSPTGTDKVTFLFSANKNSALNPIAAIASGGEIARVMLSLKSLVMKQSALPTIIFDEIDTGVSGEIAHRMGEMMSSMGQNMQVITITHLPQIAAKGAHQFKVYKADLNDSTETHLILLTDQERIVEIAEMMGGKNPSEATKETAKELLKDVLTIH